MSGDCHFAERSMEIWTHVDYAHLHEDHNVWCHHLEPQISSHVVSALKMVTSESQFDVCDGRDSHAVVDDGHHLDPVL